MAADDSEANAGFDRRLLESEATVRAWRETWPGMTTQQMCAQEGRLWMSVVTAGLIWPGFRLYRDLVLLAEQFKADNVEEWRAAVGHRGAAEVEKVVNHVHLWDVFPHEGPHADVSLGQLTLLLRDCWQAKLERDFPDRVFVVAVTPHDGPDYGPPDHHLLAASTGGRSVSIRSLLSDPDRRSYGAWAEADPFTEDAALQEAQLQDVRFDVLRARAYLLFDCRGALQIRAGNTAILVAGGVEKFCWSGRPAGRRTAWPVVGWEPRIVDERWAVTAYYVDAVSELVAASAEFYVGDVPGCDDAQPDYGDATEEETAAGLAGWDSDFELVHAMFLAPYRYWRNFSTSNDADPAWLRRIRLHDG